jgi:hypothetical protein
VTFSVRHFNVYSLYVVYIVSYFDIRLLKLLFNIQRVSAMVRNLSKGVMVHVIVISSFISKEKPTNVGQKYTFCKKKLNMTFDINYSFAIIYLQAV